jgi:hypothetical protein
MVLNISCVFVGAAPHMKLGLLYFDYCLFLVACILEIGLRSPSYFEFNHPLCYVYHWT